MNLPFCVNVLTVSLTTDKTWLIIVIETFIWKFTHPLIEISVNGTLTTKIDIYREAYVFTSLPAPP